MDVVDFFQKYPYASELPAWQKLLLYIYSQNSFAISLFTNTEREPLFKELNIDPENLRLFTDMVNRGLLWSSHIKKEEDYEHWRYSLNSEGIKVVTEIIKHHDNNRQSENQEKLQTGLFLITVIIGLTASFTLLMNLFKVDIWPINLKIIFIGMYIVILLAIVFGKVKDKPKKKSIIVSTTILTIILTIISITLGFYLTKSINLEVWHEISREPARDTRIIIYGKNHDFLRSTGIVDLYRLEVNPDTPHLQIIDEPLKPREKRILFNLTIDIGQSEEVMLSDTPKIPFSIPTGISYYIAEKTSISYKIMCDNCKSQGIVKRYPNYSEFETNLGFRNLNLPNTSVVFSIPTYSWKEHDLTDLYDRFS